MSPSLKILWGAHPPASTACVCGTVYSLGSPYLILCVNNYFYVGQKDMGSTEIVSFTDTNYFSIKVEW